MILHQVECDGVNSQAKKVRNEGEEPRTRTRSCRTDRELRGNGTFYTASGHLVFTWNTCTFIFRHLVRVQSGLSVTWMMMKWFDFFFVARTKMKYFGQNPKPGKRHLIIQKKKVVDYNLLYLYLFSGVPKMSKCNKVHSGSWCGQVQLPPQAPQLVYHCVCVSYADGWDLSQNSETEANSGTVWLQVVNVTLMSATCPGRVSFLPVSNEPQWGWTPCSPVPRPVLANEFLNKSVWGCRPHLTAPGQSCPLASFTPALHTFLHM